MAASAHAAAQAGPSDNHAQAQAEAAASVGHGTPVSQRPKKRLPSAKGKKATSSSASDMPSQSDVIPPVPQIPDMHRQASPHPGMMGNLASPMSAGYHHIPPEYQHHQHQPSPTNPNFGYPPQQGQSGDYGSQQYYGPGPQGPHGGYLSLQQQQHMQFQAEQRERARMMLEGQNRSMGMDM
jgi:hypothetical protein